MILTEDQLLRKSIESLCKIIEEELVIPSRVLLIEPHAMIDALRGFLHLEESKFSKVQRKFLADAAYARLHVGEPLVIFSSFAKKHQL